MRLWVDLGYVLDATVASEQHNHAVTEALRWAAGDEATRLIGVSTVGEPKADQLGRVQADLRMLELENVLLYAAAPDPRAVDAADAMLCLGPLTNVARLVQHGADLPPMLTCETNYNADPVAAAIVVNAVENQLILPIAESLAVAYPALCGRHVVIGKRRIAVGASGRLVYDEEGEDFVPRDVVVSVVYDEIERAAPPA